MFIFVFCQPLRVTAECAGWGVLFQDYRVAVHKYLHEVFGSDFHRAPELARQDDAAEVIDGTHDSGILHIFSPFKYTI